MHAISVAALVAGAVAEAPSGVDDASRRAAIVIGENIAQPVAYSQYEVSKRTSFTMEDEARLPGFPVRQHPVNVGRFDAGCAQCHRLAGPLPADSGAPEDVFDQLAAPAVVDPAPVGFLRLTTSAAREEYPSWSPDGTALLYEAADANGRYNLWWIGADGEGARQLTDHPAAGWAVWHPGGRRVVYWAADAEGSGNLWLLDLDIGGSVQLTHHAMTAWPQWSPDGSMLAFQALDGGTWSLRLLDPASGWERDLTQPRDAMPSRPLWSPDGFGLLYQSLIGGRFEITRLVFPPGEAGAPDYVGTPRRIATVTETAIDLGAATQHPAWSPDGSKIAFAMNALDVIPVAGLVLTYKTWIASPDGADPVQLLPRTTLADRSPTWRADGAWLALWSWNQDYRAGIWLAEADGVRRVELTAGLGGDALYPAWSPDGSKIAFAANREGTFDIWVADVAVAAPEALGGAVVRAGP